MNELPPPIQHLGRYDIVRVLGQGAMGVVYEGRDPNLDRRVAIKTVRVVGMAANEIAEYEQRFKTEARSAGRLQHPNIVSVYDSDKHVDAMGQTAYIVMEFVQGEDLKHFLDQGKRFSLEQTAYMMADLLAALDYAHKNKIVHRDIKPANMLLTREGRIKLTDFGVARITDSGEMTKTSGGTVGTLKYMSPEQVAGKGVDSSSDLFSAGIVLYQLLTGLRPFDGEGYLDIVSKIVKEDPKPPSHIVGALPPSLDAVVAKALAKVKIDRFADAASFAAALKVAVNNADLTITPSAQARPEVLDGIGTFPGSLGGATSSGSTVTQELELVYWKDIKDSHEADVLEGFLKRFPVGIYADLAKRKLKAMADAQRAAGEASRYESTQLRKPGDATPVSPSVAHVAPVATVITGAVLKPSAPVPAAKASKAIDQDATLPPSAYNDSEYGPSTQFAATQFPSTEPGALLKIKERSFEDTGSLKSSTLETAPGSLPARNKKNASTSRYALIGAAAVAIGAAAFWFTRSPEPTSAAIAAAANTSTAVVSPVAPQPTTSVATISATSNTSSTVAESTPSAPSISVTSSPSIAIATPMPPASAAARAASAARVVAPNRKASAPNSSSANASPNTAALPVATPAATPEPSPGPAPRVASSSAAAPSAPAARGPAGPREACADRVLFGFLSCMAQQCERPVFKNHPVCVERRAMEERSRNATTQ